MKPWIATLLTLVLLAAGVDFATAQGYGLGWSASFVSSVPTLVPGSFAPAGMTATQPSMSTWPPSCLDATWGAGCNVSTQTCTAPSSGTPDEPCQPPLQINITGGSGTGGTAEIDYYSASSYTFPTGTPLNVVGSTDWDTPTAGVVAFTQSTTGNCTTSGHQCITLGLAPTTGNGPVTPGSVPFIPTSPVYIQGATGTLSGYAGSTNWGFGWGQSASGGSYNFTTGALTITLANPYFGATPSANFHLIGLGLTSNGCSVTGGSYASPTVTLTYSGGCNYPVGASIGVAGITVTGSGGTSWNGGAFTVTGGNGTSTVTYTQAGITTTYLSGGLATQTCTGSCLTALNNDQTLDSGASTSTSLVFDLAPGIIGEGLTVTGGSVFNIGQQGPNGKWTPDGTWSGSISSLNIDINSVFPYGFVGPWGCSSSDAFCIDTSGTNTVNKWNYNGLVTQPWPVTSSGCTGTACFVKFAHPTACASSCVTASTQIVAGQFSGPVMAWDTGPVAPFAVENGTLEKCVSADSVSAMQWVKASLNGGAWVQGAYILDPWGVGAASNPNDPDQSLVVNNTRVYCWQFPASSVNDGEQEIRACGAATAGPITCLTSAITAEATAGSSTLKSNMHYQQDANRIGITKSQDPAFITYNNAYETFSSPLAISAASYSAGPPTTVTYTYSPGTSVLPFPVGWPLNITGITTTTNCPVTGGTANGNTIQYTYSGGCSFPVGTSINVAGVVSTAQVATVSSASYSATTGLLTVNLTSATWGSAPGYNGITQFTIAGMAFTGGVNANPNGLRAIVSTSGGGTTLVFNMGPGLATAGLSGGTITDGNYAWNGNPITVTATNGSSNVSVTGMALGSYTSGGTIATTWNEPCSPTAVTGTTITCPLPTGTANPTPTLTLARVQSTGGLVCVVGGTSDNPAPFNPAFQPGSTMDPNHFQLQPFLVAGTSPGAASCSETINFGGCSIAPCGIQATINSTLWLYRQNAGMAENRNNGPSGLPAGVTNDGSLWVYTNAHSTIMEQAVYVDQWGPSAAVTATCIGSPFAAESYNATRPTYAGSYCANGEIARASFWLTPSAFQISPTVTNASSCSVFTSSTFNSAKLPAGSPMIWIGVDPGVAGDGSNALFSNYGLYWVKANVSGAVTLSATPQGACINETATMSGVKLQQDLGMKDVFFECDQSAGCVPNSVPETAYVGGQGIALDAVHNQTAESGWLNYSPDTANGTGQHDVDLVWSPSSNSTFNFNATMTQSGRVASNMDHSWKDLTLTPAVSLGPTLNTVTVTGGTWTASAVGSCSSDCETLTFAAATDNFTGATFQAPTAAAPGQGLLISGVTGDGAGSWNCGTTAAPCTVTGASTTSVTFQNTALSGAAVGNAGGTVVPLTLAVEVPNGTFANNSDGIPCTALATACSAMCTNPSTLYQAITPAGGNQACVAIGPGSTSVSYGLSSLFPFYVGNSSGVGASETEVANSNCIITPTGGASTNPPFVTEVISGSGGNNDVIILQSFSAASPVYTFNNCATMQWDANGPFLGSGALDSWDHDNTITGNWFEGSQGGNPGHLVLTTVGGTSYITNQSVYNAHQSSDHSGYVWGSSFLYNVGTCHNTASTAIHLRCIGGAKVAPTSIGAYNWLTPASVVNSYSSYANYKAGTPITCSGTPCITTASKVFTLTDNGGGTMPKAALNLQWGITISCGFYPAGIITSTTTSVSPAAANISWFDKTADVIETSSAATGTCTNLASTAVAYTNGYHTDLDFRTSGVQDIPGTAHEFANRGPWITMNNIVMKQVDTWLSADTLQSFTEGGIMMNMVMANSHFISNGGPIVGQSAIAGLLSSSYGCYNCLYLNDQSNGSSEIQISYNANTNPSYFFRAPLVDLDYINLNVGGVNGQFMPGYPIDSAYSILDKAYRIMSESVWSFNSEQNIGPPFIPAGLWPSTANNVNLSGAPLTGGQDGLNSLLTCPWYCVSTDTGNGLW